MSLSNLYNKTVSTERLGAVEGSKKEAWEENLASLSCAIHPVEGSQSEMLEGGFFNTFKMFCASGTDLLVGDRVIDGDDTYTVKGSKSYNFAGNATIQHMNITLVKSA
jgi:hypothetical protein